MHHSRNVSISVRHHWFLPCLLVRSFPAHTSIVWSLSPHLMKMSSLDSTSSFSYCPFLHSPLQQNSLNDLTIRYSLFSPPIICHHILIRLLPSPPLPNCFSNIINNPHVAEFNGQVSSLLPLDGSATFDTIDHVQLLGNTFFTRNSELHTGFLLYWFILFSKTSTWVWDLLVVGPLLFLHTISWDLMPLSTIYVLMTARLYFHTGPLPWKAGSSIQPSIQQLHLRYCLNKQCLKINMPITELLITCHPQI